MSDKRVKSIIVFNEEVPHFCIEGNNYYAVSCSGRCFNIIRAVSIQLPIDDVDNYITHLFIEAKEGFFLLKQEIKEGKPGVWILEKQIIPFDETNFFYLFEQEFKNYGYKIFD